MNLRGSDTILNAHICLHQGIPRKPNCHHNLPGMAVFPQDLRRTAGFTWIKTPHWRSVWAPNQHSSDPSPLVRGPSSAAAADARFLARFLNKRSSEPGRVVSWLERWPKHQGCGLHPRSGPYKSQPMKAPTKCSSPPFLSFQNQPITF